MNRRVGQFDGWTKSSRGSFAFSRRPLRLDLNPSVTASCVVAKTAPLPGLWTFAQPSLHRIAMNRSFSTNCRSTGVNGNWGQVSDLGYCWCRRTGRALEGGYSVLHQVGSWKPEVNEWRFCNNDLFEMPLTSFLALTCPCRRKIRACDRPDNFALPHRRKAGRLPCYRADARLYCFPSRKGTPMFSKNAVVAVLVFMAPTVGLSAAAPTINEYAISVPNNGDLNSGYVTHLTIVGNVVTGSNTVALPGVPHSIVRTVDKAYLYISVTSPLNGDGLEVVRTVDDVIVTKIALTSPTFLLVRPSDSQLFVGQSIAQVTTVDITKQADGSRKNVILPKRTITLATGSTATSLAFTAGGGILSIGTDVGMVYNYTVTGLPALLASHQIVAAVQAVGQSSDLTRTYAFLQTPVDAIDKNGNSLPAGNVHIMDTPTLNVFATQNCSPNEIEAALLVRKQYFYVTQIDGTECTVDTSSDTVVNTIAPGGELLGESVVGNRLFMANLQDNDVETLILGTTPTSDKQGVSFGNMPTGFTVVRVSVF